MSEYTPERPRRRRTVAATEEGSAHASHAAKAAGTDWQEGVPTSHSIPVGNTPVDPAYVTIGAGFTENLGNFESLRLDARVTLPCGTSDEEIKAAAQRAGELVTSFIEDERRKALGDEGTTD